MQSKISKSLEAIIKRTTTSLIRDNINTSYIDRLIVELLSDEATFCSRLLNDLIGERGVNVIMRRVMQGIITNPIIEVTPPESRYSNMCDTLCNTLATKRISTAHALYYAASDAMTATSHELRGYGINAEAILHTIEDIVGKEHRTTEPKPLQHHISVVPPPIKSAKPHPLDGYGENITQRARNGEIDPVIGRDAEIERIAQILSRRKKCNPILIGEAGVGKSAIIEGLALSIVKGNVPQSLIHKEIYALDMAILMSGTKFRGEFEERVHKLLETIEQSDNIILFIDEIHTIVGAGASPGALDIANMLKPALARGKMLLIGATTPDEYRQSIERDAALERRFQSVRITPTTEADTLHILRHLAPYYGNYHNVQYSDEALEMCIHMASRYIPERHFPDKAIDIMDEAGVWAGIETSMHNNKREVTRHHVEHVTHLITGLPIADIAGEERERIASLRDHLQHVVIGQEQASTTMANALMRLRSGLTHGNRPWGVFLFVGPTGVGKTLMAKEFASWLNKDRGGFVRIDMSEYSERHSISRLIGSPPGYVGYGEGGELTEAVRRNPYAVVLLDEADKAHPEVYNLMLQIFDDGHITDTMGRVIDFRHTAIIMTSNLGAKHNIAGRSVGFIRTNTTPAAQDKQRYLKAIHRHFRPELIARIDEIVAFNTLDHSALYTIARRELETLHRRVSTRNISLHIESNVAEHIATHCNHTQSGARAIRQMITTMIENPLSAIIVNNHTPHTVAVIIDSNEIAVREQ